jgi:hypothetical protein
MPLYHGLNHSRSELTLVSIDLSLDGSSELPSLHTKAIHGINPPIMIGERQYVSKMKLVGLHSVLPRRNADNDSGKFAYPNDLCYDRIQICCKPSRFQPGSIPAPKGMRVRICLGYHKDLIA